MRRDHLRLVSSTGGSCDVSRMDTLSLAQVEGGLVILHNDRRIAPPEAIDVLLKFTRMLQALTNNTGLLKGRVLPGELGGFEEDLPDGAAMLAVDRDAQPLFAENRHQCGYPVDRPRPICAETEGDCA